MDNWRDKTKSDSGLPSASEDLKKVHESLDAAFSPEQSKSATKAIPTPATSEPAESSTRRHNSRRYFVWMVFVGILLAGGFLWFSAVQNRKGHTDEEKRILDLNVTITRLKADLDSLKAQVGGINSSDFERIKNTLESLNSEGFSDLRRQNDELKRQNGDFKKQNSELQRKLAELESRIGDLEKKAKKND